MIIYGACAILALGLYPDPFLSVVHLSSEMLPSRSEVITLTRLLP